MSCSLSLSRARVVRSGGSAGLSMSEGLFLVRFVEGGRDTWYDPGRQSTLSRLNLKNGYTHPGSIERHHWKLFELLQRFLQHNGSNRDTTTEGRFK